MWMYSSVVEHRSKNVGACGSIPSMSKSLGVMSLCNGGAS